MILDFFNQQGFEVRQYPAAKWVCNTDKNVIPSADPLNGWQQKFDNDPLKVMSSSDWKNQASSKMFMKLFKYISGANSQGQEVKMTTPVPTKHTTKGYDSEETQMCFWLGKKWQDQIAPRPLEKDAADTEVVETQPRKVSFFMLLPCFCYHIECSIPSHFYSILT